MKSEERHHLAENDLAQILDRWLKKIEPYSNQILLGILIGTVAILGILFFARSGASASEEAWTKFAAAESADDYATVADDYPHSNVTTWARLRAGELYLAQGMQTAVSDRKSTTERLEQAESSFNQVLQAQSVSPEAREQALYGLAVVKETLSDGNTQPAVETYEELLKSFPDSRFAGLAKHRVDALKTEEAQSFYAWFDKQERRPDQRPEPKDLNSLRSSGPSGEPLLGEAPDPPAVQRHPNRPPSPRPSVSATQGNALPFPEERPRIKIVPGETTDGTEESSNSKEPASPANGEGSSEGAGAETKETSSPDSSKPKSSSEPSSNEDSDS